MKKLFTTIFILAAFILNAQGTVLEEVKKPTYEKEGDLVKVTKYFDSGEVKEKGFYDADKKLTGKWMQFNKKGKKTTIAHYYKGKKVGKWFVWKADLLLEVDYEDSKIASVNEWKGESTIADN